MIYISYFLIACVLFIGVTIWREIKLKESNTMIKLLNEIINTYAERKGDVEGRLSDGTKFKIEKDKNTWGFLILIKPQDEREGYDK
jgi:hypothetical protein